MSILSLLASKNYITYNKTLAKEIGVDEAILFGELCSLCRYYGEEFYCEQDKIINDTCLTEYRVRNALKTLQSKNLVRIVKKGLPAKNYYTLCEEELYKILDLRTTSGVKFDTTTDAKFDTTCDINNSTTNNTNNTLSKKAKNNNNNKVFGDEFEQLWSNYPNKQGKERAKASYIKARNSGVSYETILDGLNRYVEHCNIKGKDKQYIKHGSTWFAQSCWQDDYDMTPPKQQDEVTRGENGVSYIPYEQLSDKEKEDFDFWG